MGFKKLVTYSFLFVFTAGIGAQLAFKSWDSVVYFYPAGSQRDPAAIRKVFDFSHLEGGALKLASNKRLIEDARLIPEENQMGIELGHFVSKNENGQKDFACNTYDKVELSFESGDVFVSGSPSLMIVDGPCKVSADINRIQPLWIPMAKILQEKPGDIELQYREPEVLSFKFINVGDAWPRQWNLRSVKLYNSGKPIEVYIGRDEIIKTREKALSFYWE